MRTCQPARFSALLLAMATSFSATAWSADEGDESTEPGSEGSGPPPSAEESSAETASASESEEAWPDEALPGSPLPTLDQAALHPRSPAARPSGAATLQTEPADSHIMPDPSLAMESPLALSRRIQQARQLAAQQRKARSQEILPEGLSREELEIRAGERNVAIYDKQIAAGEGTSTIEAYRKYALQVLADTRRQHLARIWASTLQDAEAPRILHEHAQRMAELKRIRLLADLRGFSGIVRQTDELLANERQRFEARMRALAGGSIPGTAGTNTNLAEAAASR